MFLIENISSDPLQRQTLTLEDGTAVTITMYFRPLQYGWFFNEISWQDFTLQGLRITVSPNMLNQFKNQIPFGIACISKGNREPQLQDDFVSGQSKLYILSRDEVEEFAEYLRSG